MIITSFTHVGTTTITQLSKPAISEEPLSYAAVCSSKNFNLNRFNDRNLFLSIYEKVVPFLDLSAKVAMLSDTDAYKRYVLLDICDNIRAYSLPEAIAFRKVILAVRLQMCHLKRRLHHVNDYQFKHRYYVHHDKFGKIDVTRQIVSLTNLDRSEMVSVSRFNLISKTGIIKDILSTMPESKYPRATQMGALEKVIFDRYLSNGSYSYRGEVRDLVAELSRRVDLYPCKVKNSQGVETRRRKRYAKEVLMSIDNQFADWRLQGPFSGMLGLPSSLNDFISTLASGSFKFVHEIDFSDRVSRILGEATSTTCGLANAAVSMGETFTSAARGVYENFKTPLAIVLLMIGVVSSCKMGHINPAITAVGLTLGSCIGMYIAPHLMPYISSIIECLKGYFSPGGQQQWTVNPVFELQGGVDLMVTSLLCFAFHGVFNAKLSKGGLAAFLESSTLMKKYSEGATYTLSWIAKVLTEFYEWVVHSMGQPNWSFSEGNEVMELRNEVWTLMSALALDGRYTQARYNQHRLLTNKARVLFVNLSTAPTCDMTAISMVKTIIADLEKHSKFKEATFGNNTIKPVATGLVLIGPSQCGKTASVADFGIQALFRSVKDDKALMDFYINNKDQIMIPFQGGENFHAGYQGQEIVVYDDGFPTRPGSAAAVSDTTAVDMLKFIGPYMADVEQAEADLKGKIKFTSSGVIMTTNLIKLELPQHTCTEAIARRFPFTFMVWVKDEFCLNPKENDFMKRVLDTSKLDRIPDPGGVMKFDHLQYRAYDWQNASVVEGSPSLSFTEVVNLFGDRMAEKRASGARHSAYVQSLPDTLAAIYNSERDFERQSDVPSIDMEVLRTKFFDYLRDTGVTYEQSANDLNERIDRCKLPDMFPKYVPPAGKLKGPNPIAVRDAYILTLRKLSPTELKKYKDNELWDFLMRTCRTESFSDLRRNTVDDVVGEYMIKSSAGVSLGLLDTVKSFLCRKEVVAGVIMVISVAAAAYTFLTGSMNLDSQSGVLKAGVKGRSRYSRSKAKQFVNQAAAFTQNFDDRFKSVADRNVYSFRIGEHPPGLFTMVSGTVGVMPVHFLDDVMNLDGLGMDVTIESPSGDKYTFTTEEILEMPSQLFDDVDDENDQLQGLPLKARVDCVLVKFPSGVPKVRDISKLFISEDKLSKLGHFQGCLYRRSKHGVVTATSTNCRIKEYKCGDGLGGFFESNAVHYGIRTVKGECGSLLWVTDTAMSEPCVISMHVAGVESSNLGAGVVITYEALRAALDAFEEDHVLQTAVVIDTPFEFPIVRTEPYLNQVGATALVRTEEHGEIWPNKVRPAMLRPTLVDGVLIDPNVEARRTIGRTMALFDRAKLTKVSDWVSSRIISEMGLYDTPRVLSFEEACSGYGSMPSLSRSSSAGYPLNLKHKGKSDFFGRDGPFDFSSSDCAALKDEVHHFISEVKNDRYPEAIFMDFLKDEPRSFEKYYSGKTRLISGGPLVLTIVMRMYFGCLLSESTNKRIVTGNTVGIIPYTEWGNLLFRHQSVDRGAYSIDNDFKAFDGSQESFLMETAFLPYSRKFYFNATEEEDNMRAKIFSYVSHPSHITNHGNVAVVYKLDGSNPSGQVLTTLLNELVNQNVCTYAYLEHDSGGDISKYNKSLMDEIVLSVFGDDNIVTVSRKIAERTTPKDVGEVLAAVGMTMTNSNKGSELGTEYKHILQCKFLKRSFKILHEGYVAAPLELDSIFQPLNWCKKSASKDERRLTVEMCLGELSLHGREVFEEWAPKIIEVCRPIYGHLVRTRYEVALAAIKSEEFSY